MIQQEQFNIYLVSLLVKGLTSQEAQNGLLDLQEELEMRPYLDNPKVTVDKNSDILHISFEVEAESITEVETFASNQLLQCVVATIDFSSKEGIHIEVLHTEIVP